MADWLQVILLAVLVALELHSRYRREIQRLVWRMHHRRGE